MASKSTRPAPKDVAARRARVEEMRRQAKARERRVRLAVTAAGLVIVAAIVAVIVVAFVNKEAKKTAQILPAPIPPGAATPQKPLKDAKDDSGIPGVKAYDTTAAPTQTNAPNPDPKANSGIEHTHVPGPVTYVITPPVGGPHNDGWMTCGRYTSPVPTERAVHDLEHGAVWITYRKSLPAGQVKVLEDLFGRQKDGVLSAGGQSATPGGKYLDLTPWGDDTLPSPVVVTAWGRQLGVDDPGDPRLQPFIDKFRLRQDLSYETGAQCTPPSGNLTVGGRPAGT